jgi:23S rRNA (adenine2503-C2)-methyltransferase
VNGQQTDIRKLDEQELIQLFTVKGEKSFRARQVYSWLWKKSAQSFEQMTDLSKPLRQWLQEDFAILPVTEHLVQKSTDGTVKTGMKLFDGQLIEGVMIPDEDRSTACVSSQVGCSLACTFCATGFLKRARNVDAAEIYDQVVLLRHHALQHHSRGLTNIVFMGMGEPLLNYDQVMRGIQLITSENGLHMSPKRITISTSGIARNIVRMADEGSKVNLALSLHAATNEKRDQIMDINRSNNLETVMDALQYFYQKTGNKITFEYVLLHEFNDRPEDAEALSRLCRSLPAFVNLIEFNAVEGVAFKKTPPAARQDFVDRLRRMGVEVKVRRSRGKDIDAACGQLANKVKM